MPKPKASATIGIRVSFQDIETKRNRFDGDNYAHIDTYVCVRSTDHADDWTIPRPYHETAGWVEGLKLRAQTDGDKLNRSGVNMAMYGYKPEWHGDNAGLEELERGVKALKRIHKSMDAMAESDGRPQSFGQYLLRLAKSIGAGRMVIQDRGGAWRTWTLAEGASVVDNRIRKWAEHVKPDASQSATG